MKTVSRSRRALSGVLGVGLGALSLAGCVAYVEPAPGVEKVLVCHKGKKTLSIAESARDAHLRHGDTPGPCR